MQERNLWGIVLAAGKGTRVREFLRQRCDGRGIKQFSAVIGHRSMLEHTLAWVERLIPREQLLVIVSVDHREEVAMQLSHWPTANVIFQTENRDTAPGILLPLVHICQRAPFATVAIFPSDHFILDEARFINSVRTAVSETHRFPHELTLLGMTPTDLAEGYGWIEPGDKEEGRATHAVRRFWEKPARFQAYTLLRRGALWNTFVCVAQANAVWEMTRQAAPNLYRDFTAIRLALQNSHADFVIENLYRTMRPVNFSRNICETLPSRLRILPVPDVGWSDWGSAERICASLAQLGKLNRHLAELGSHQDSTAEIADDNEIPERVVARMG